jgi:putative hydrolase of the HAD superfamily/pyrimidine and pyridine-specific 5'-nucleotidase
MRTQPIGHAASSRHTEPRACVFADDSVKNIKAAKEVGWRTVLVGLYDRDSGATIVCPEADAHIDSLHDLRAVMPELF